MNDLLLIPVIFLAIGRILILLWRLFLIASGLFFIGFVSFLIFVEGYGIYLFFTEPTLYMEDLSQNGLISFTGFYAVFNLSLLLCGVLKIISWTRRLKIFLENKKLARFTHYLANTRVYTSYCKDDHLKEGRRQPYG